MRTSLKMILDLCKLRPGQIARLHAVQGTGPFRRRLMEMGLLPGTTVRLVRSGAVSDLVELEVRGMLLSVRREDAQGLSVEVP